MGIGRHWLAAVKISSLAENVKESRDFDENYDDEVLGCFIFE